MYWFHSSFNRMQREVYENSVSKGFWDDGQDNVLAKLALIHSEVSEAVEAAREPHIPTSRHWLDDNGKPEGFGVELADAVIRIMDLAEFAGIDLAELIATKHVYNTTRPRMHGKLA